MTYTLYHGDCLKEMDRIEAGSVDMILADLPYGTTACTWDSIIPFEPLWAQYKRILKKRGVCVLFGSQPFTSLLIVSNLEWFKYTLVWEKTVAANFMNAKNKPLAIHEDICIFSEGTTANGSNSRMTYNPQGIKKVDQKWSRPQKYPSEHNFVRPSHQLERIIEFIDYPDSILRYPNPNNNRLHSTEKPVSLLMDIILTYSNSGDLILDSTMGSGSTGEAALRTGRHFIGVELYPLLDRPIGDNNPDYFGIAERRLDDVARELRGEWKPLTGNGHKLDDLPLFEGLSPGQAPLFSEAA